MLEMLAARVRNLQKTAGNETWADATARKVERIVNQMDAPSWTSAESELKLRFKALQNLAEKPTDTTALAMVSRYHKDKHELPKAVEDLKDLVDGRVKKLDARMVTDMHRVFLQERAEEESQVEQATHQTVQAAAKFLDEKDVERARATGDELARLTAAHLDKVSRRIDGRASHLRDTLASQRAKHLDAITDLEARARHVEARQRTEALGAAGQAESEARREARHAITALAAHAASLHSMFKNRTAAELSAHKLEGGVERSFRDRRAAAEQRYNTALKAARQASGVAGRARGSAAGHANVSGVLRLAVSRAASECRQLDLKESSALRQQLRTDKVAMIRRVRDLERAAQGAAKSWLEAGKVSMHAQRDAGKPEGHYERAYGDLEGKTERMGAKAEELSEGLESPIEDYFERVGGKLELYIAAHLGRRSGEPTLLQLGRAEEPLAGARAGAGAAPGAAAQVSQAQLSASPADAAPGGGGADAATAPQSALLVGWCAAATAVAIAAAVVTVQGRMRQRASLRDPLLAVV